MRTPLRLSLLGAALFWFMLPSAHLEAGSSQTRPVQTVKTLELKRFMGKWYEIASIPTFFTRDCTASTATYTPLPEGGFKVENACRKDHPGGEPTGIRGKAWSEDPSQPGQLKISFFWLMEADYWIIALDEKYEVALVGESERDSLWLMARTPRLEEVRIQAMLKVATEQGYDVRLLKRTQHAQP